MSTTLHLTGQVILTDSTGTRLPATDLATALDSDGKVVVPEGANAQLKGVVESIAKTAQKLEN